MRRHTVDFSRQILTYFMPVISCPPIIVALEAGFGPQIHANTTLP
jgi:hypothetical protein